MSLLVFVSAVCSVGKLEKEEKDAPKLNPEDSKEKTDKIKELTFIANW